MEVLRGGGGGGGGGEIRYILRKDLLFGDIQIRTFLDQILRGEATFVRGDSPKTGLQEALGQS